MSYHPLERHLSNLRSRALRLALVRGLGATVASVLALALGLGMTDYVIRFRDRGVLLIFATVILAVFAWTASRLLGRLRKARLDDTALAMQVEARIPSLKDRLASAVEFLKQPENDACAGSAAMRRAAIAQAAARCDEVDFGAILNFRPAFRAALSSLAVCLLAAGLMLLNPAAARTALARLVLPLGSSVWPQKTHLQLATRIERIARGQPLEIEVVDTRGEPLPADCRVHYRLRDAKGKASEESEAMRPLGPAMIARRENMTRPLDFRVSGGDDQSMPWMAIEVLDPPVVTALSVEVIPPGYTNWPRETRDSTSAAPILAGSRVELSGEASKPLRSAVLRLENGRELPGRVEGDGRRFRLGASSPELPLGLVVERSSAYAIALEDCDGLRSGEESRQFHVQADAAPTVTFERPKGDLFVTPSAHVNLRIDARDDLGLREVSLVYSASGATVSPEAPLLIYEGRPQVAMRSDARSEVGGERRTIDRLWDLRELRLLPRTQLTVYAAATDYRPQTGRSEPRTFTIITPEEFRERLAERQRRVLAELARLLELQRDVRGRVCALALQLQKAAALGQNEIDRLQSAEYDQREIVAGLTDRADGVPAQALGILSDLETNLIDNPDFVRRMQGLLDELDRIQREHFSSIGDELTVAIKGEQSRRQSPRTDARDAEDDTHLARAVEHQQQVIESLEAVLSQFRQWDDYRRFQREVSQLLRDQEELARLTAELGRQTLGRDLKELLPQETADLMALVDKQFELARRQNRIEQEMEQTVALLRPNEPAAADTLSEALAESRRLVIAGEMLGVGGKIRDNGLGQAPADHQMILQNLQAVLDILANNRGQEDQRLARELGDAARIVDGLRKRQEGIRRKLEELAAAAGEGELNDRHRAELETLLRQQEEIRQETLRFARRLERLGAGDAADSAKKAAEKMEEASRAQSPLTASRHAKEAEELLDEVGRLLDVRIADHRIDLVVKQQARLAEAVQHLHHQEERITAETREFAALERAGPLSRAQIFGLLELARQQALLRDETDRLTQTLAAASAFRLGLSSASVQMQQAAEHLQQQQTGPETLRAEQAAIARLALLVAALEPESKEPAVPDRDHVDGSRVGNPGGAHPSDKSGGIALLAEVKFLKLWQEDLNRRTQQLDLDSARAPQDELRKRQADLAQEQAGVAEAALRLQGPQETHAEGPNSSPHASKEN